MNSFSSKRREPLPALAGFKALLLLSLFFSLAVVLSASLASATALTDVTVNQTNSSTVSTVANFSLYFRYPNSFNYSIIYVEFPSNFSIVGSQIFNTTNLQAGSVIKGGFETGLVSGQNISFIPTNNVINMTSGNALTLNVTNVILPISASAYTIKFYANYTNVGSGNPTGLDTGTVSFTPVAGKMVNVSICLSGICNVTNFVNVSGSIFNVTVAGQDAFGNTNKSGGFNFQPNDTSILVLYGASGGNGTGFTLYNATNNGTAWVNVSAVLDQNLWNSTGANFTVNANSIVLVKFINASNPGVTVNYPTASNSSVSSTVNGTFNLTVWGFDLNNNINNSGGFNFYISNFSIGNYVSGNGTKYGVFNTSTSTGTATITVIAVLNSSATNTTTANATVHPQISGVASGSVSSTSATLSWTTNETGNDVVEYGTSASYGSNKSSASFVASHSVSLSGLTAGTIYHYRVDTCSAYNLCSLSSDGTFTTSAAASSASGGGGGGGGSTGTSPTDNSTSGTGTTSTGSGAGIGSGTNGSGIGNGTTNITNSTLWLPPLVHPKPLGKPIEIKVDAVQLGIGLIIIIIVLALLGVLTHKI